MGKKQNSIKSILFNIADFLWNRIGLGMRTKLIIIFFAASAIPMSIITIISLRQIIHLGRQLSEIAAMDSANALNEMATENIERLTTDTARDVANFLYARDMDILYLAEIKPSEENYRQFIESKLGRLERKNIWSLAPDGKSWIPTGEPITIRKGGHSTNSENNDMNKYNYRNPDAIRYNNIPLYDEISYIDLEGNELIKVTANTSPKKNYPLSPVKKNVSLKENTYIKAETYFPELSKLAQKEIYVSDVIGAYVGTNYIGMYVPDAVAEAANTRSYDIQYDPEKQAYAGMENPNGERFEGIIRWATPVSNSSGEITGYVTFALNHDHIMEFVDHITPMNERYTSLPSAFEGNYAFIWDYKCRNICHPRHHSIVGYNPETGDPETPWLESSIYNAWQESGVERWNDFIIDWPLFDEQSRKKTPAAQLTREGLVGLDGRYLNNAPQCTGWMDLTEDGGSGSFFILWSGLYKLTTAAAIPYYTGQYAPAESNGYSLRGFGIVTIGAGLEDFSSPATEIALLLNTTMGKDLNNTIMRSLLIFVTTLIIVILIAIRMASFLTGNITYLINGLSRFRDGERQFRFAPRIMDEFGTLAEAFDSMADSIEKSESGILTIIDLNHKVIYMNNNGLNLYKKSLADVTGMVYSDFSLYPKDTKYDPIASMKKGVEAEAYYHEGTKRYFKGVANYFFNKFGIRVGYIISSVDVTEIQTAREAADQASKAKGDFLSNMSHEIRTPLNAIIGMTSMGTTAVDINRKNYCLNKINDASKHLLGVINDILDMSKIEANKLELSLLKFNFEKMIQRVIDVTGFRLEEKQQHFNIHIDKRIPMMIISDEQRIAQVITNLLSNAVKFTPKEGTITCNVSFIDEINDICTIQVDVSDTGIGITKEQIPRLFNVFEQAERSTSRKFGGTGLGLAISKRIVEMLDGTIWIKSEPGKGSEFSFTIKAKRGEENRESLLAPGVNWKNIRILVVDDEPEVLEYFKDVGEQLKISCDTSASGQEALNLIEQNGRYDIYFIDWKMPGMDGIELSRRINKGHKEKHVIVMISSTEWIKIQKDAEAAGVDKYLQKPLFISSIADCINECMGRGEKPEVQGEIDDFSEYRVLLAEDVEINREIVMALLEPSGLKIDCAENGAEAVRIFSENNYQFDMIFMDLQMPEVDGFEATRRIRGIDAEWAREIPIIAMTANVFKEDIENCLAAGMNDHIGKPLDINEVLEKLRRFLPKKPKQPE